MIIPTLLLVITLLLGAAWYSKRYRAPAQPVAADLSAEQAASAERLQAHVQMLAGTIGERNMWNFERLLMAADYIEAELRKNGLEVSSHSYELQGRTVRNLVAQIEGSGKRDEIVVIGAHYDSVIGSPGANDNGSGVAALLELGRRLAGHKPQRTLRLIAFVNEEPPFFQTGQMGSRVYVREALEKKERIVAMVSLETIGYYSDAEKSQQYPSPLLRPFYPSRGNFVAFVSNLASTRLLNRALAGYRRAGTVPAEGIAAPEWLPGVNWSDQWSFWKSGIPAIMITDTAPFRYQHYHSRSDTPDKIDYRALAGVTEGLFSMVVKVGDE